MNVEIGAEAALFPEKEYISGIFVVVQGFTLKIYLTERYVRENHLCTYCIVPMHLKTINSAEKC
jgi:hypothetical protein